MLKPISHYDTTTQEYVEIIYNLQMEHRVARIKDISEQRGVTPSSVSTAVGNLVRKNLANHQKFGYVDLTDEGLQLGKALTRRHKLVRFFLENVLGVVKDVAEKDACLIEHVITSETSDKLLDFIEFVENNPRGGPQWLDLFKQFQKIGEGKMPDDNCPLDSE